MKQDDARIEEILIKMQEILTESRLLKKRHDELGEEYFEVLDGLRVGDSIAAGPYQAIRDLKDSAKVKPMKESKDRNGPNTKKS